MHDEGLSGKRKASASVKRAGSQRRRDDDVASRNWGTTRVDLTAAGRCLFAQAPPGPLQGLCGP